MKKTIIVIGLICVVGAALFLGYALYTEKILVRLPMLVLEDPVITFSVGNGYYRETPAEKWKTAIVGSKLKYGWEIKTEADSFMDIRFTEDMAVRVSEDSQLRIDMLTIRRLVLQLQKGSAYGKFDKLFKDHEIEVKTHTTIAAIRGTTLGFELTEVANGGDSANKKTTQSETSQNSEERKLEIATIVYSMTGITEVYNPAFDEQRVLLSNHNKILVKSDQPPGNPEPLTEKEIERLKTIFNSIHTEEVLLITDKILFEVAKADILPQSNAELDKIVEILKKKRVVVRIEGHTDFTGDASFNQALSRKRAFAIRNYLVKNGVDPFTLEVAGYGASKPIASNATEEGRSLNRRVEFIIVK